MVLVDLVVKETRMDASSTAGRTRRLRSCRSSLASLSLPALNTHSSFSSTLLSSLYPPITMSNYKEPSRMPVLMVSRASRVYLPALRVEAHLHASLPSRFSVSLSTLLPSPRCRSELESTPLASSDRPELPRPRTRRSAFPIHYLSRNRTRFLPGPSPASSSFPLFDPC